MTKKHNIFSSASRNAPVIRKSSIFVLVALHRHAYAFIVCRYATEIRLPPNGFVGKRSLVRQTASEQTAAGNAYHQPPIGRFRLTRSQSYAYADFPTRENACARAPMTAGGKMAQPTRTHFADVSGVEVRAKSVCDRRWT